MGLDEAYVVEEEWEADRIRVDGTIFKSRCKGKEKNGWWCVVGAWDDLSRKLYWLIEWVGAEGAVLCTGDDITEECDWLCDWLILENE